MNPVLLCAGCATVVYTLHVFVKVVNLHFAVCEFDILYILHRCT